MKHAGRMLALVSLLIGQLALAQAPDAAKIERGRYLAKLGGCNDCHTAGYAFSGGQTPEAEWLLGDTYGQRGPWGTTYPANLRLLIGTLTEDQWVALAKALRTRPPMPWFTLNEMHDEDLRALYAFIRQLGPAGNPAPAYLPPDQEPSPPFATYQ